MKLEYPLNKQRIEEIRKYETKVKEARKTANIRKVDCCGTCKYGNENKYEIWSVKCELLEIKEQDKTEICDHFKIKT